MASSGTFGYAFVCEQKAGFSALHLVIHMPTTRFKRLKEESKDMKECPSTSLLLPNSPTKSKKCIPSITV
jgi:hypothetical protein